MTPFPKEFSFVSWGTDINILILGREIHVFICQDMEVNVLLATTLYVYRFEDTSSEDTGSMWTYLHSKIFIIICLALLSVMKNIFESAKVNFVH